MDTGIMILSVTTLTAIGHTLLGPDHYMPFVALAKGHDWSMKKTVGITLLCGLGHIAAATLFGVLILRGQLSLSQFGWIESGRAEWAAWGLIGFGVLYGMAAWRRHAKNTPVSKDRSVGFLLAVVILGPCEPLLPLMMCPPVSHTPLLLWAVIGLFGFVTVLTTLALVVSLTLGFRAWRLRPCYRDAVITAVFVTCGLGIKFLG